MFQRSQLFRFLLLMLIMRVNFSLMGQSVKWGDGPLRWDDFYEKAGDKPSSFYFYLQGRLTKEKHKDSVVVFYEARAALPKDKLWVDPAHKTPHFLQYHQILFDIVELHRRRLQYALFRVRSLYEVQFIKKQEVQRCQYFMGRLYQETLNGADTTALAFWEGVVNYELSKLADVEPPKYQKGKIGYGMEVGMGTSVFGGKINDYFAPAITLGYGFQFSYNQWMLLLDLSVGRSSVRKSFAYEEPWQDNERTLFAQGYAAMAYRFLKKRRVQVVPFLGYGLTEMGRMNGSDGDEEKSISLHSSSAVLGVRFDYRWKLRQNLFPSPLINAPERVETLVSTRLFVTPISFPGNKEGYAVSVSFSIGGFGRVLHVY